MTNNMNSGYVGYSMSKRSSFAYDDGEMPRSKWTKKAMIAVIGEYLNDNDLVITVDLNKMKKDEIFETYFMQSSWHHTSKMCNATYFYKMSEGMIDSVTRSMTKEELAERERIEDLEATKIQKAIEEENVEKKKIADWEETYHCSPTSALAGVICGRDFEVKIAKKTKMKMFVFKSEHGEQRVRVDMLDTMLVYSCGSGMDLTPTEDGLKFFEDWSNAKKSVSGIYGAKAQAVWKAL